MPDRPEDRDKRAGHTIVAPEDEPVVSGRTIVVSDDQRASSGDTIVVPDDQRASSGQTLVVADDQRASSGQTLVAPDGQRASSSETFVFPDDEPVHAGRTLVAPDDPPPFRNPTEHPPSPPRPAAPRPAAPRPAAPRPAAPRPAAPRPAAPRPAAPDPRRPAVPLRRPPPDPDPGSLPDLARLDGAGSSRTPAAPPPPPSLAGPSVVPSGTLPDETEQERAARLLEARGYLEIAVDRMRRANERGRLYGLMHPEAQAAVDDAWAPLHGALELVHPVKVHATLDGMIWEGELLVPEDDDKPGLGRLLHREGIQSLAFHEGMVRDELVGLLGVLRLNLGLPEYEEETLDSLLWQADLPHVSHKAVAAIMRAEAISGDAERFLKKGANRTESLLEGIQEMARSRGRTRYELDEQALARAMQGQDAAVAPEGDGWDDELPDEDWERRFAEEAEEDADALRQMADAAAAETPGDVTARLGMLLFDTARERRAELLTREALKLAEGALADLVRLHASRGLARLLAALDEDIEQEASLAVRERLEEFRRMATDPTLIARVLAHGEEGQAEGDEAAAEALLRLLDDGAIRALVEWSFGEQASEDTVEQVPWLDSALGAAAARRARAWLSEAHGRPELLVPGIRLLRARDQAEDRALRPHLLFHEAGRVVEETLSWYARTGIPEGDMDAMGQLLLDRRPRIRRSAVSALEAVGGEALRPWFARQLRPEALGLREPALQVDLCEAAAAVLGERSLRMLEAVLLESKVGLFAGKEEGALLEAAAAGLVRLGSPAAKRALEQGAKGWVRVRSQACKAALSRFQLRGRPG